MKRMIRIGIRIRINYEKNYRDRDKHGIMKRMIRIWISMGS